MRATAIDTSVLIAALLTWHDMHEEALQALRSAAEGGALVVPAPALVEAYAVLTHLPSPHRLASNDAQAILSRSFERRSTVVGLTGAECLLTLDSKDFMRLAPDDIEIVVPG